MDPISRQIMGGHYASIGAPNWFTMLGSSTASYNDSGGGIATNGNDVFVVGDRQTATGRDIFVAKYNSSGIIQWQRTLGDNGTNYGYDIALDTSDNVYITGYAATSFNGWKLIVAKYNSSGVLQWQNRLGTDGTDTTGYGIDVDLGTGDVYITGTNWISSTNQNNILLVKYNSSGVLQWQRSLTSSGGLEDRGQSVTVDYQSASPGVIAVGYTYNATSGYNAIIAKYTLAGTLSWQRLLNQGTAEDMAWGVTSNAVGDIYVSGHTTGTNYGLFLAKYNSAGTLQWQRILGNTGIGFQSVTCLDYSNNIYVCGFSAYAAGDLFIAKYQSDGTLLWQRTLIASGGSEQVYGITAGNTLCIIGTTNSQGIGANDALILELPTDGTKTGTYGVFTYSNSSLTPYTSGLTGSTPTFTSSTSTFTNTTLTFTDSPGNLLGTAIYF